MENPKFWSPRRRRWKVAVVACGGVLVGLAAVALRRDVGRDRFVAAAPIVAVLVAVSSLVITAASTVANWRRQRREATLKAWHEWSDASKEARRMISRRVGVKALTQEQGRALVEGGPVPDVPDVPDDDTRREVVQAIVGLLNGLERLAVGVEVGVYDLSTLARLGGTIIVRWWERSESYIAARRTASNEAVRQDKAFRSLEVVVTMLKSYGNREDQRALDQERLETLRRNR